MQQTVKNIEKAIKRELGEYYHCAWREKIVEMVENEEREKQLVEWIKNEIEIAVKVANVVCPADMDKKYTDKDFALYLEQMQKIAVLSHFKTLLLHFYTTNEMRKNIEYTIGKIYGVKYDETMNSYV